MNLEKAGPLLEPYHFFAVLHDIADVVAMVYKYREDYPLVIYLRLEEAGQKDGLEFPLTTKEEIDDLEASLKIRQQIKPCSYHVLGAERKGQRVIYLMENMPVRVYQASLTIH